MPPGAENEAMKSVLKCKTCGVGSFSASLKPAVSGSRGPCGPRGISNELMSKVLVAHTVVKDSQVQVD